MELTARIHIEEGSYWADVPELPGCFAPATPWMSCSSPCKRASLSIWPMRASKADRCTRRDGHAD